jgi:hypothetical protein
MPGYPRVDRGNDYLMTRFDGAVVDGLPWGRGHYDLGSAWLPPPRNATEKALKTLREVGLGKQT